MTYELWFPHSQLDQLQSHLIELGELCQLLPIICADYSPFNTMVAETFPVNHSERIDLSPEYIQCLTNKGESALLFLRAEVNFLQRCIRMCKEGTKELLPLLHAMHGVELPSKSMNETINAPYASLFLPHQVKAPDALAQQVLFLQGITVSQLIERVIEFLIKFCLVSKEPDSTLLNLVNGQEFYFWLDSLSSNLTTFTIQLQKALEIAEAIRTSIKTYLTQVLENIPY